MAKISINQLAEFSSGTTATRTRIIKQQIKVNKNLVPWYQFAKACIRRFLSNVSTHDVIAQGIETLQKKEAKTKRQLADKQVSIEALKKIRTLKLPKLFSIIKYEIVKPDSKYIVMEGVDIIISPDIIIKAKFKGKIVYGACKIHICKSKPFDHNQGQYVATLLHQYLITSVAQEDEIVLPELCFCLDVFSDRIVSASDKSTKIIGEIKTFCLEVKKIWDSLR